MRRSATILAFALISVSGAAQSALAQLAPEIGYVYPPGARAGSTVEVRIGGYDWTPDTQVFVHDSRIKLEIAGPPGEVLVPPPPYWFGAKGRGYAWPLPREYPARLTIPADVAPGNIRFQAANANGASPVGFIAVGNTAEIDEDASRKTPQLLAELPVTVNGRIDRIEEVDRYEFVTPQAGPVSIELVARRLGSPLHGLLKVADDQGKVVVDVVDTEGDDLATSFIARAGAKYTLSLHDLDFAGDRSYVYRLAIRRGPRVSAAYPAAGRRGTTQSIEFVGLGISTGANRIETLTREVPIPAAAGSYVFSYVLETLFGPSLPISLQVSDVLETAEPAGVRETTLGSLPCAVTGSLESRFGTDRFALQLKPGEQWRIEAQARDLGSPLDPELTLFGPDGKEIASSDDAEGTTNALLTVTSAAEGKYTLALTDRSGKSGGRDANYRLVIEPLRDDFSITVPAQLSAPLGGAIKVPVKVARQAGFKGPIQLLLAGLPAGVTAPADWTIAEGKGEATLDLACAADAPAAAALATLSAIAKIGDRTITRAAPLLLATTMKPRIKITPEGLDDVRKVHRGSTFLAPLFIERLEGYQGEVTLEMTAKQQRHRQGLASRDFVVPPTGTRVEYPIFVPEWMETTKTSRMILNGVVKVPDPKGNVRTLVQRMEMRIGILPEGALLKISSSATELSAAAGEEIRIPLTISRAPELKDPLVVEFVPDASQAGLVAAEAVNLAPDQREAVLAVRFAGDPQIAGDQPIVVRATARQDDVRRVVSETTIVVSVRAK
ncbi:MAG: hypothetical protein HY290_10940 [Planctomycetia bacterium]|nr:hypothetical protein [Planctomycetia bacterium]